MVRLAHDEMKTLKVSSHKVSRKATTVPHVVNIETLEIDRLSVAVTARAAATEVAAAVDIEAVETVRLTAMAGIAPPIVEVTVTDQAEIEIDPVEIVHPTVMAVIAPAVAAEVDLIAQVAVAAVDTVAAAVADRAVAADSAVVDAQVAAETDLLADRATKSNRERQNNKFKNI